MREIKFRGKDKLTNQWVYGYFVGISGEDAIIISANQVNYDLGCIGVSECHYCDIKTIGQFTGLTDKNGKKIFEGDILKDDWGKIFEVIFTTSSCGFMVECIIAPSEFETGRYRIGDVWCNTISVIGNIYDNPELLKGDNVEV